MSLFRFKKIHYTNYKLIIDTAVPDTYDQLSEEIWIYDYRESKIFYYPRSRRHRKGTWVAQNTISLLNSHTFSVEQNRSVIWHFNEILCKFWNKCLKVSRVHKICCLSKIREKLLQIISLDNKTGTEVKNQ